MLVAGTVAFDLVARVPRLPGADEAVLADEMVERFGGCAGNVARGLARLGHRPHLVSAVGRDFPGSAYQQALLDEGVNLSDLLVAEDRPTARAFLAGDPEGSQTIVYHPGATPSMCEIELVAGTIGHFGPGELSCYPHLMEYVDLVTFNPGQETFHRPLDEVITCLESADILLCNEHEARRLTDHVGGKDALLGTLEAMVITDQDGQQLHTTAGTERLAGVPATVVDATGAGDAHNVGFVHGLTQGWDLATCCRFGSAVSACVVEHAGAQAGLPTVEDAIGRYRKAYGEHPGPPPETVNEP